MPSLDVRPTRIELIRMNRRIKLARRGLDLLKMKRSSLVMEFFNIARTVRGMRENLREEVGRALETIRMAELLSGTMTLERIAYMSANSTVGVGLKNVMGVKVPELNVNYSQTLLTREYRAVSVPTAVNDAIVRFERVFILMTEIAEKENAMRRLLYEIERTKRRSNAIENILIPQLVSTAKMIRMHLDEMERDTFTTLKFIKRKMGEKERDGPAV
ncbi:V-type ATP synthase subunit D [Thermogymnomonas acidicola]|uniref:A-type ATP synthase subunit D n=1 Tax=Thermogymnomonas acidicola TaxID=399579 RepID=A0AA37BPR6_9ARCH|nr:V-type ATP synthase subunit D [Thermogymnomonas acidicola]GGM66418.1 V-type ATP synthase subunit D [Thermogymnomonas acidicola]